MVQVPSNCAACFRVLVVEEKPKQAFEAVCAQVVQQNYKHHVRARLSAWRKHALLHGGSPGGQVGLEIRRARAVRHRTKYLRQFRASDRVFACFKS